MRNSGVEFAVCETEFFTSVWVEQQVALATLLATASDGGLWERPVVQPEPPAVPPLQEQTRATGHAGMRKMQKVCRLQCMVFSA